MAEQLALGVIGLGGGLLVASGAAAMITGLGILSRYAGVTRTPERVLWYEDCAMHAALDCLWGVRIPAGPTGACRLRHLFWDFSGKLGDRSG